ncbi:hypothetical protein GV794_22155 [Nocardia cyriacigeorgica]|uniref:Uncharacterized protein n=1 Tax=Nocardia cyriacigeorgica TaxID=135487 RepID=A0A6P1D9P9_9NOCA|nr:hypothetical protein [Nocardia cyriacigeorgica]NEW40007.1 hypothetical protein [Nocardia cyriacigeorgica]NEW46838.1 hypothetical protein [Nocardia cyriacigeorgica]NEW53621.1 hypothetical protein [Nocardia cyriacigeorgica]NEW58329.1 hypothetical protein [Nocardia cyriacigeorgica]
MTITAAAAGVVGISLVSLRDLVVLPMDAVAIVLLDNPSRRGGTDRPAATDIDVVSAAHRDVARGIAGTRNASSGAGIREHRPAWPRDPGAKSG